jgi:hypothetical protein
VRTLLVSPAAVAKGYDQRAAQRAYDAYLAPGPLVHRLSFLLQVLSVVDRAFAAAEVEHAPPAPAHEEVDPDAACD